MTRLLTSYDCTLTIDTPENSVFKKAAESVLHPTLKSALSELIQCPELENVIQTDMPIRYYVSRDSIWINDTQFKVKDGLETPDSDLTRIARKIMSLANEAFLKVSPRSTTKEAVYCPSPLPSPSLKHPPSPLQGRVSDSPYESPERQTEQENTALREKAEGFHSALTQQSAHMEQLHAKLAEQNARICALEAQLSKKEAQDSTHVTALTGEISQAQNEKAELEERLEEAQELTGSLAAEIHTHIKEVLRLRRNNEALNHSLDEKQERIADLQLERGVLEHSHLTQIEQIHQQMHAQQEMEDALEDLPRVSREGAELYKVKMALKKALAREEQSQVELGAAQAQVASLQEKTSILEKQITALNSEQTEERARLQQQLTSAKKETRLAQTLFANANADVLDNMAQTESLLSQLQQAKGNVSSLERQLTALKAFYQEESQKQQSQIATLKMQNRALQVIYSEAQEKQARQDVRMQQIMQQQTADVRQLEEVIHRLTRQLAQVRDLSTAQEREITTLRADLEETLESAVASMERLQTHYANQVETADGTIDAQAARIAEMHAEKQVMRWNLQSKSNYQSMHSHVFQIIRSQEKADAQEKAKRLQLLASIQDPFGDVRKIVSSFRSQERRNLSYEILELRHQLATAKKEAQNRALRDQHVEGDFVALKSTYERNMKALSIRLQQTHKSLSGYELRTLKAEKRAYGTERLRNKLATLSSTLETQKRRLAQLEQESEQSRSALEHNPMYVQLKSRYEKTRREAEKSAHLLTEKIHALRAAEQRYASLVQQHTDLTQEMQALQEELTQTQATSTQEREEFSQAASVWRMRLEDSQRTLATQKAESSEQFEQAMSQFSQMADGLNERVHELQAREVESLDAQLEDQATIEALEEKLQKAKLAYTEGRRSLEATIEEKDETYEAKLQQMALQYQGRINELSSWIEKLQHQLRTPPPREVGRDWGPHVERLKKARGEKQKP